MIIILSLKHSAVTNSQTSSSPTSWYLRVPIVSDQTACCKTHGSKLSLSFNHTVESQYSGEGQKSGFVASNKSMRGASKNVGFNDDLVS